MAKCVTVYSFQDDDILVACKMPVEVNGKIVYDTLSSLFKTRLELVPKAGDEPLPGIHFGDKYRGKF